MLVDHERARASFLAADILFLLDHPEYVEPFREKLANLALAYIKNHFTPIQSLQCAIETMVLLNVDFCTEDTGVDSAQLFQHIVSMFSQDGVLDSVLPNAYADARNFSSGIIALFLLLKKYLLVIDRKISSEL